MYGGEVMRQRFSIANFKVGNFFNLWEQSNLFVNIAVASPLILLYFLGSLDNIRESAGSIISYASALLTINGVFLTLLVTLKGSPVFVRLKRLFPKLHNYLYKGLKKQIISCIGLVLVNLLISIVGPTDNLFFIIPGIIIWSYLMIDVSIGALYNLKVVTDLATKEIDGQKPMT